MSSLQKENPFFRYNNREFGGGVTEDGKVVEAKAGEVADPGKEDSEVGIDLPNTPTAFHGHTSFLLNSEENNMKKYVIILAMLFAPCLLMGQKDGELEQANSGAMEDGKTKKKEDNQLYEILLESFRLCMKRDLDHHNKIFKDRFPPPKDYICKDGLPADFPFERLPGVTFFHWWNIGELAKSHQEEFKRGTSAYFVIMKLIDNHFIIVISTHGVKRVKKNRIETTLGESTVFTYEYSCEKKKWLLVKTKGRSVF